MIKSSNFKVDAQFLGYGYKGVEQGTWICSICQKTVFTKVGNPHDRFNLRILCLFEDHFEGLHKNTHGIRKYIDNSIYRWRMWNYVLYDFTFLASKGVFVDAVQPSIEMTKKSPKKHAQKRSAESEQTEQQQEKITRMDTHLHTGKD